MASLVQWLAYSGARKSDGTPVASGTAYFFQPGTTNTQIAVYSDEDGLTGISQPVTLDASGRAEVYLMDPARVEVQDSTGATVRLEDRANTITAAQVEIENTVATGTSLTTGTQVAGGRTDLDTFLSNLHTSLGTQDGKVLISGAGQNIKDVIGGSTSIFFNVKVSPYSAVGDDSTDDTAAIQSAINAAAAAGGGIIYFPPGTYKTTASLTITSTKVQFLGVTPSACILKKYTGGTGQTLTVSAADFYCSNIGFVNGNAGMTFISSASTDARFVACAFTMTSNALTVAITATTASARLYFLGCTFTQPVAGSMLSAGFSGATISIVGGRVNIATASSTAFISGILGGVVICTGVEFNHSAASGSTPLVDAVVGLIAGFSGCYFPTTGGGTLIIGSSGSQPTIYESGSVGLGQTTSSAVPILGSVVQSSTRALLTLRTSGSATSYTPDYRIAIHDVISSGASFQFATPSGSPAFGGLLHLRYKNTNAGAITPTFGAGYKVGTAPSVATNSGAAWTFVWDTNGAVWYQVGGNSSAYAS